MNPSHGYSEGAEVPEDNIKKLMDEISVEDQLKTDVIMLREALENSDNTINKMKESLSCILDNDEDVIIWGIQEKTEIGGFYMIGKRKSEQAGCIAYVANLNDAKKICELLNEDSYKLTDRMRNILECGRKIIAQTKDNECQG